MEVARGAGRSFKSDDDALKAWNDAVAQAYRGEWNNALAIFIRLADDNYEGSASVVAQILERGPGAVSPDLPKAEEWYEVAVAENTNPDDKLLLARLILRRDREEQVPPRKERVEHALLLLNDLVANQDPYAAILLGTLHFEGKQVPQSHAKAERFYEIAADQEFVIAVLELSRVAWQTRRFRRALWLRLRGTLLAIRLMLRNIRDKRLFLLHQGLPSAVDKASGWYKPGSWIRFE